jgi:hypothetical protein
VIPAFLAMRPSPRERSRGARVRAVLATLALAVGVLACGATPTPSGPLGPCGSDAKSIGGYPELEQLVPRSLEGRAPDEVNSGRSCSDTALGTLTSHDVHELHFAGATWNQGSSDATVVAVLATPADQPTLQVTWVEEFYTAGAVAGKKTDNVTTTHPTIDPVGQVFKLEALNDLSLQTVVIWADRGLIHVVIVVSNVDPSASRAEHDRRVAAAVAIATVAPAGASSAP